MTKPAPIAHDLGSIELSHSQICRWVAEGAEREMGVDVSRVEFKVGGRLVETPQIIFTNTHWCERMKVEAIVRLKK